MHPWELDEYTFYDYCLKRQGAFDAERERLQNDFQHIRYLAYHIAAPYLKKEDANKGIDSLFPDIYIERKEEKPEDAKASYDHIMERYYELGIFKRPDNVG